LAADRATKLRSVIEPHFLRREKKVIFPDQANSSKSIATSSTTKSTNTQSPKQSNTTTTTTMTTPKNKNSPSVHLRGKNLNKRISNNLF